MKPTLTLITALLLAPLEASIAVTVDDGVNERRYDFYQPQMKHVVIHEGKLAEGHYAYNHMASVEWFDGKFHVVWGAHTETHLEGKPGQLNVWSTSPDFETWSVPQPLAHVGHSPLPRDPVCVQWQPNLLNYRDQQLWCVWPFNSKNPATSMASIDPVDFAAGQSLEFRFETKVLRLQEIGMLILCSLGDRIPIRLGMPANRPGKLYAYTRSQWEPVGDFPMQQCHSLRVTVRGADFSVAVNDQPPKTFPNPIANPKPRLYLGDGFEVDCLNSNSGSEFLVDLGLDALVLTKR